ncbi:MAG: glycosyltransferase family 4 protein [Burkholderiales bacterium]
MAAAGWRVEGACADGHYMRDLRGRGCIMHALPIARSLAPHRNVAALAHMLRLLKRERYDILHVHTPVAALLGRIAGRLAGVPMIVYTAHGFYFHEGMPAWKRRAYMALEWIGGRVTDLLFTQSAEDAATAVTAGFVRAENVVAIGNGVDPGQFPETSPLRRTAARARLGVPADALVVGMIGRLVEEKGYPEFLAAAVEVAGRFPTAVFVAVGERLASDHAGCIDTELTRAHAALGDRLLLTGQREDIPDLLAAFDLFTLPSYREGMPRTIIEAMMTGLPVVATDIRGSREEVVHDETGLLVPVRDARALAAAWNTLLADAERRERMGKAGRARALSQFDERAIVERQIREICARLPPALRERA